MRFLLELASEEIPARMQAAAAEQLRSRFVDGLKAAGLGHGDVVADATPRRLWLIADEVAAASAAAREERKGPAASAPETAIAGFLRSTGLTRDQLEERATPKGVVLFAQIATPGRDAGAILADLVPAIVRDFQWPKSMRWGEGTVRWVRPLTAIVALLGDDVVACEAHGVASGRITRGHRIHAPEAISVERADTYAAQLLAARVVVSSAARRERIAAGAAAVAAARGLTVIPDDGLVAENAGLTEWPVAMVGAFDPAFLAVPREVIQLTMRTNQKYFAVADADGALAPGFVCVANLEASDGGAAIVAGNERVLSARLSDAKFFWDQDVAKVRAGGLEAFLPTLSRIVFHDKLGTVADKVNRVAKLARAIAPNITATFSTMTEGAAVSANSSLDPRLADTLTNDERDLLSNLAEQAARICKADLVSATVGEFPEVQGIAGSYLAHEAGLDPRVADAIRDHYRPVGHGDAAPTAPVSVAVALADKFDNICSFFDIGEMPSGSKDPYAIRRSALGILRLLLPRHIYVGRIVELWLGQWNVSAPLPPHELARRRLITTVTEFLLDRLEVQQREAGIRHDYVAASRRWKTAGDGRLDRVSARAVALQTILETEDGANLLAGVKRAANILRIEEKKHETEYFGDVNVSLLFDSAETALATAIDVAVPKIDEAINREDFTAAMSALAGLRPAVDAFFDTVIVNAPDPAVRLNRLGLLARLRAAANSVADFSRIEG